MKIENTKSKFEHPVIKVIQFEIEDIITKSDSGNNVEKLGIDLPMDALK